MLVAAAECLTGTVPTRVDARPFLAGGAGRAIMEGGRLTLTVPAVGAVAQVVEAPEVVVVYETPPVERARFAGFQRVPRASGVACLGGGDARAWHAAAGKGAMVARFRRAGVAHMETLTLHTPDAATALAAFTRPGTWRGWPSTRPALSGCPSAGSTLSPSTAAWCSRSTCTPVLDVPGGLPGVAVPFVKAHFDPSALGHVIARHPRV